MMQKRRKLSENYLYPQRQVPVLTTDDLLQVILKERVISRSSEEQKENNKSLNMCQVQDI